jgi:hypothetical protein
MTRLRLWTDVLLLDVDQSGFVRAGYTALPKLSMERLVDQPAELSAGSSFLKHPDNYFDAWQDWLHPQPKRGAIVAGATPQPLLPTSYTIPTRLYDRATPSPTLLLYSAAICDAYGGYICPLCPVRGARVLRASLRPYRVHAANEPHRSSSHPTKISPLLT